MSKQVGTKNRIRSVHEIDTLPRSALITRAEVGAASGYSRTTLKNWPAQGRGPRITVIEGRPRYRVGDYMDWVAGVSSHAAAAVA